MDVGHAFGVVEAELTPLVVQVDAEAPGPFAGRQGRLLRGRQRLVLLPVGAHAPNFSFLVRPHGLLFATSRFAGCAHRPTSSASHLYLPVVTAGGEALGTQHAIIRIETFGVVRQVLAAFAQLDAASVEGEAQARVGCVGVQGHIGWKGDGDVRGSPVTPISSQIPIPRFFPLLRVPNPKSSPMCVPAAPVATVTDSPHRGSVLVLAGIELNLFKPPISSHSLL